MKKGLPMRITLQQIRDNRPCQEGWRKLLTTLGNPTDMSITVSIGEIAKSNGPQNALWCLRCANFDRKDIIKAILPSVKRALQHSKDERVSNCIQAIEDWLEDRIDIATLKKYADAAAAYATAAAYAAADAAYAAIYADADAAAAAAYATAAAYAAEKEQQVLDICAIFP